MKLKFRKELLSLNISKKAACIIESLNNNGFEAYLVGGCVRDSIMGKGPKDWDITTSANPDEIINIFTNLFERFSYRLLCCMYLNIMMLY